MHEPNRHATARLITLLSSAALLLLAAQAQAQTGARPKMSTRDEYRSCLNEEDALDARRAPLEAQRKVHNAALKRLQDDAKAHAATQPAPDAGDAAIDAFNAKIDELDARVEVVNREAERLQAGIVELNTQIAAANRRCAGLVVSITDIQAVRKERAKAAPTR